MKPYYNTSTRETYRKYTVEMQPGFKVIMRAITGSVGFEGENWVERNEFGHITKSEPLQTYGRLS